jgi:hypothetical protein
VEKRGLQSELAARGVTADEAVAWVDEMRVGLRGTTRRGWGIRGMQVRQLVQTAYQWRYLALAVDGRAGTLWWCWTKNLRAAAVWSTVQALHDETNLVALVWDRAKSHQDTVVREVPLQLIEQPPYAPELNPAERVFEYLRAQIEGRVYASLDEKVAAVNAILGELDAAPARVRSLAGWRWITAALDQLPTQIAA